MRETRVWSLGQEDPLEKEVAAHCSVLAWRQEKPMDRGAWRAIQSTGMQRVRHDWSHLAQRTHSGANSSII